MGEVIAFLRSETEKRENLIEEFLQVGSSGKDGFDKQELRTVMQNVFSAYSSVEKIRERYPQWVMFPSNRLYDSMKALISLDALPEINTNLGLPKDACVATVAGYLYVYHLLQIHAHGLGHLIQSNSNADDSVYRVLASIQDDLSFRRLFFDKVRSEISMECKAKIKNGVDMAFSELEKRLHGEYRA